MCCQHLMGVVDEKIDAAAGVSYALTTPTKESRLVEN